MQILSMLLLYLNVLRELSVYMELSSFISKELIFILITDYQQIT